MAAEDDLTRPLGQSERRAPMGRFVLMSLAGMALVAVAAAGGTYAWLNFSPASQTVTGTAIVQEVDSSIRTGSTGGNEPASAGLTGLSEVEPSGGLQDIGRVVIHDPSSGGAMQLAAIPDPGLVDDGPYGPLPRISSAGLRPLEAYARPASTTGRADRIAIVIGGIGINLAGSSGAIRDLPGEVTLAIAPYSDDVSHVVREARNAGHELLLQIPMEPFNYPANDPGPETLTVANSGEANIDNLHWLFSRASNYVGVVNYLGARFTADSDAMTPILAEIGRRGLLYLDDGTSSSSIAPEIARGMTPFAHADLTLDVDLDARAIDLRLDQLQAIARERGYAVGVGSAFPITVERVAAFAERAAQRGIEIVPVSALVLSSRG